MVFARLRLSAVRRGRTRDRELRPHDQAQSAGPAAIKRLERLVACIFLSLAPRGRLCGGDEIDAVRCQRAFAVDLRHERCPHRTQGGGEQGDQPGFEAAARLSRLSRQRGLSRPLARAAGSNRCRTSRCGPAGVGDARHFCRIGGRPLSIKDQLVYISAMSHQAPVQLPRGRPRSFDTEAAVERAMGVFWSRGYHGTALPDLLRATKLSRGSLYAAFGDKHSLFLRALDRYVADALTRMDIELAPRREPVDGLRAYLAGYVDLTSGSNRRRGCLLVATAMELAGHNAEVDARIGRSFNAMSAG